MKPMCLPGYKTVTRLVTMDSLISLTFNQSKYQSPTDFAIPYTCIDSL